MADISKITRLVNAVYRELDLNANSLVMLSVKVGGTASNTELTKTILDKLVTLQDGTTDASSLHNHNSTYNTKSIVASTTVGQGASLIGIADAGNIITATTVEGALQEIATNVAATTAVASAAIPLTQKGVANGVASLDSGGKVPIAQLPNSIMEYQGTYNASTNTPTLVNGTGNIGDVYRVNTAGAGVNSLTFVVGDYAIYNGTTWEKAHSGADNVVSVNGYAGIVVLSTTDIAEGTNLYYTDTRAKTAAVVNTLVGSQTDQAPSVSSVKAYVASQVTSAPVLSSVETAGMAFAASTVFAVRWGIPASAETSGTLYKAEKATAGGDLFNVSGLIFSGSAVSAAGTTTIVKAGKMTATAHGLTVGLPFFLSSTGTVTSTAPSTAGDAIVRLGIVQDANTLDINVHLVGVL